MMFADHTRATMSADEGTARNTRLMRNPEAASRTDAITSLMDCRARYKITVRALNPAADINNIYAAANRTITNFLLIIGKAK
jgi:hypothetical protein